MNELCDDSNKILVVIKLLKMFLQLIQLGIPIILIVWGTIDLGRAVVSADETGIKKAQSMLIKRLIAGVLVFLVVLIVNFTMGIVGNDEWKTCWDRAERYREDSSGSETNIEESDTLDDADNIDSDGGDFSPGTSSDDEGRGGGGAE